MGAKEYIFMLENVKKKQVLRNDSTQIFKDMSNFLCKRLFFEAIVLHGAPWGTILGLIIYDGMSLYFVGKKSNLTGLCEILNNFDLDISEFCKK